MGFIFSHEAQPKHVRGKAITHTAAFNAFVGQFRMNGI